MNSFNYTIIPHTERSVYLSFGQGISTNYLTVIQSIMRQFNKQPPIGFIEAVPAYNNIAIYYKPMEIYKKYHTSQIQEQFIKMLEKWLENVPLIEESEKEIIQIPVCYDERLAPDIHYVARSHHLSVAEVVRLHSERVYLVHMLGFSPGFPFLGGMNEEIATPRKTTPASRIEAGSVGIAGKQTGIYPHETPGGWQIIGRTPQKLFSISKEKPALLKVGDVIQFQSISYEAFYKWKEDANDYNLT